MSNEHMELSNPELKEKLEALRVKDDVELREAVYREIADGAQFLSVVKPLAGGTPGAPEYDFPVLTTPGHGYRFYPVFTDMEELRKWNDTPDVQTLVLTFDAYAAMVERDSDVHGVVINPCGANFSMERDLVDYLNLQKTFVGKLAIEQMFQTPQQESGVQLLDPEPYPEEMVAAMTAYLAAGDTVRRAWLRLMVNEGETSYLVILDAAGDDAEDAFTALSSAALPYVDGRYLDLLLLDDPFAQQAAAQAEPFYQKQDR